MIKYWVGGLLVVLAVLCPQSASAGENPAFMTMGGKTTQPIGHYEFCKTYRTECAERAPDPGPFKLTPKRWSELLAVNEAVNKAITPVSDEDVHGKPDVWSFPTDKGDCEDYVLLKRRQLVAAGWPAGDLLITVVRQVNGEGHAVLTVRTDRGDLVLDNLESKVLVWNKTPYQFVKRVSETDAGVWMAIADDRNMAVSSIR